MPEQSYPTVTRTDGLPEAWKPVKVNWLRRQLNYIQEVWHMVVKERYFVSQSLVSIEPTTTGPGGMKIQQSKGEMFMHGAQDGIYWSASVDEKLIKVNFIIGATFIWAFTMKDKQKIKSGKLKIEAGWKYRYSLITVGDVLFVNDVTGGNKS